MTKPKRRYLFYLIKFHDESIVCILYCRGIGGAVVTATVTSAVGLITHERACYHLIMIHEKIIQEQIHTEANSAYSHLHVHETCEINIYSLL